MPMVVVFQKGVEMDLELMAQTQPEALLDLIESGSLSPERLTFAAEYAGKHISGQRVEELLMGLLTLCARGSIIWFSTSYGISTCKRGIRSI